MDKQIIKTSMSEISPLIMDCFAQGLDVTLTVTGNSMQPFLEHNRDQVVLAKTDGGNLKKWDVPLYIRQNGQYVLHRIIAVREGVYTMMGDAQTYREEGILPDQIIAVARGFYRKGRYIDCQSRGYRLWTSVWWQLRGVRPYLLRVRSITKRMINGKTPE